MEHFAPGSVFAGDYRIVRPLSQGGMGAVFVVEQLSTGKLRALKLMHRELVYNPQSRQKFEQEARIGARIASEHVVEVQSAGVDAQTGTPYLVMELLEGEDLHARLKRGAFSPAEASLVLEQIAHALGAAHDASVVHRDLKPENIFLAVSKRSTGTLVAKILDFGIAKVTEDHRKTTGAYGTPLWLAPEQTRSGQITPAADVWALGLLVFAMLTGHSLWRSAETPGASIRDLLQEILTNPIPAASSRAAEYALRVPPGFDAWLARALDRDPRARFPNARAAWAALAPILSGFGTAATAFAETPPPTSVALPKRSVFLPIALVLLAVVAVGGALAVVAWRRSHAPELRPETSVSAPIAPTATPSVSAAPSATSEPTASATPTADAASRAPIHVGAMVTGSDATVKDDATKQINGALADRFDECAAKNPTNDGKSSNITVSAVVAPNGTVKSASTLAATPAGPGMQCIADAIKTATFPKSPHGASLLFTVYWH